MECHWYYRKDLRTTFTFLTNKKRYKGIHRRRLLVAKNSEGDITQHAAVREQEGDEEEDRERERGRGTELGRKREKERERGRGNNDQ